MRLAPVALRWHNDEVQALKAERDQSQTTHGALKSVEGCALLTHILVRAINGESKDQIFDNLNFKTQNAEIDKMVRAKPWRQKLAWRDILCQKAQDLFYLGAGA